MTLFRLDTSILPGTSASAELADLLEAEWSAARPGEPVVRRHLGIDPLPADAWTLAATNPAIEHLQDLAVQRHIEARDAARRTGRTLSARTTYQPAA